MNKNKHTLQHAEEKEAHVKQNPKIGFKHLKYSVVESAGHVSITIEKKVPEDVSVWVRTFDDTAFETTDYEGKDELITMKAHEQRRDIQIRIVDDCKWEPDKDFMIELLDEITKERLEGDDSVCCVTILDEDKPGNIGFKERIVTVRRKDEVVFIHLERNDGADGDISCLLNTRNDLEGLVGKKKAKEGIDFESINNRRVEFKHNVTDYRIEVLMPECSELTKGHDGEIETLSFCLEISDPKPEGVKISKRNICIIDIVPDDLHGEEQEEFERQKMLEYFLSNKEIGWCQQFKVACMLGPQIDDDNHIDEVTCGEAAMHFLAMPWKVFFALVPPRHIWGGWLAFIIALMLIGIVTAIVGEVAALLGCAINLKTAVTAITLVAMGTSLPDTFASKTAAQNSKYADSAVGNVTGSNSVNVFLGLGLPWTIAAIYWKVKYESSYMVPPGSLAFSVTLFLITSLCCFVILGLRRCFIGGELGGAGLQRPCSALILVCLWLIYIIGCSLQAYGVINVEFNF